MSAAAIELSNVSAGYGRSPGGPLALENITISIYLGEICAVLGPNGAGKSTLVRVLSGALPPRIGRVFILGEDVRTLDRRAMAQRVAVVSQTVEAPLGFTVGEAIMMGRAPHQGAWMSAGPGDKAAVDRAIAACELAELRDRPVSELSGGEQKRVAIARALAQEAKILILDEAGAHLDVHHSITVHEVVRREVRERKLACVAILHDLNVAAQYADNVALLKKGRLVDVGSIEEVMTYARLKDVFETELYVGINELDDTRYFLPVRPRTGRDP